MVADDDDDAPAAVSDTKLIRLDRGRRGVRKGDTNTEAEEEWEQWIARRMAGCQIAGGREVLRQVKDDTAPPREISIPSMSFPKLITLPL